MPTPIQVKALNDYQIRVKYSDGVEGVVDLSMFPAIDVSAFWSNHREFQGVSIGTDHQIAWKYGDIELCPDSIYRAITGRQPAGKGVFDQIIQLYENQLDIPSNNLCHKCDSYKHPLLPWQIGDQYFSSNGRILIAGKPHREEKGKTSGFLRLSGVLDGRVLGNNVFFGKLSSSRSENWPYWSYTREILKHIYGSCKAGWEHIAFTNIVKCSSSHKGDQTSRECARQCIRENKVIFKEIEILKPRKIIFYTWTMHRHLLYEIPCAKQDSVVEHTNSEYRRRCGQNDLGWWDRSFESIWGDQVDFLVVMHPERKKKDQYVKMLVDWL